MLLSLPSFASDLLFVLCLLCTFLEFPVPFVNHCFAVPTLLELESLAVAAMSSLGVLLLLCSVLILLSVLYRAPCQMAYIVLKVKTY